MPVGDLLVQFIASYGVMFAVSMSTLPWWSKVRDEWMIRNETVAGLFSCPFCSGFWASLLVAVAARQPWVEFGFPSIAVVIMQAFAGAAVCMFLDFVRVRLEP